MLQFRIKQWAAWAPGLDNQNAWQAWLANPGFNFPDDNPALSEMPAMLRRRAGRLGKVALQPAYWALENNEPCPVIFASRYGDMSQAVDLLSQLDREALVSPAAFSMSVHNAIGALFSIARKDHGAYTAVAAGEETIEAAFAEAQAQLADGANGVMVVYYEEPLPPALHCFALPHEFPRAFACYLVPASSGICLNTEISDGGRNSDLPADLAALRFLLSDDPIYKHTTGGRTWVWQRHA